MVGYTRTDRGARGVCQRTRRADEPLGIRLRASWHAQMASKKCPSLPTKKLSPHVLRHTSAMIVLQATHDIRKVSLWLGHSNLATTEIYTRADPTEKLEAIEAVVPPHLRKGSFRPPDKLIALLKAKSAKS